MAWSTPSIAFQGTHAPLYSMVPMGMWSRSLASRASCSIRTCSSTTSPSTVNRSPRALTGQNCTGFWRGRSSPKPLLSVSLNLPERSSRWLTRPGALPGHGRHLFLPWSHSGYRYGCTAGARHAERRYRYRRHLYSCPLLPGALVGTGCDPGGVCHGGAMGGRWPSGCAGSKAPGLRRAFGESGQRSLSALAVIRRLLY